MVRHSGKAEPYPEPSKLFAWRAGFIKGGRAGFRISRLRRLSGMTGERLRSAPQPDPADRLQLVAVGEAGD